MGTSILSLTSELHEAIASHLELEDLLNLGSTCQQLYTLVSGPDSNGVWSRLYEATWAATAQNAKHCFKMRC